VSAVWLAVRTQLKSGWKGTLALLLLVGFGGGVTLVALSGARRADNGLARFVTFSRSADAGIGIVSPTLGGTGVDAGEDAYRRVYDLPEVSWAGRIVQLLAALPDRDDPSTWHITLGVASVDGDMESTFGRPIVVSGRLPRGDQRDEVAINEELAARHRLRVGSTLPVGVYSHSQFDDVGNGRPLHPEGLIRNMTVVGIVRYPPDLLPVVLSRDDLAANHSILWLTPAFWRDVGPDAAAYGVVAAVRLRDGADDVPKLRASAERIFGENAFVESEPMIGFNTEGVAGVRKATHLEALSLAGFGLLTAIATILLLWQALRRQLAADESDAPTLRALGLTDQQLIWIAAACTASIALVGTLLAIGLTFALSPLVPIGVSRRTELDHGVWVDWLILGPGAAILASLVVLGGAMAGWRAARAARTGGAALDRAADPSRLSRLIESSSLPVSAATGVRMALVRGRGRRAIPVTSLLIGAAVGLAGVTAALTFGASLRRVVTTPTRYGVTADAQVGNYADRLNAERGQTLLENNPDVASFAGETTDSATLDGQETPIIVRFKQQGSLPFAMIEGASPSSKDEIALGLNTARRLGKKVGDTVVAEHPVLREPVTLRVVGIVVLNSQSGLGIEPGGGAALDSSSAGPGTIFPSGYLIRFKPGVDHDAAAERLRAQFFDSTVYPVIPPTVIGNYSRVSYLPGILAGVLIILALGVLVHGLITVVRRRRHELAILKAVGFTGHQVLISTGWEATAISTIALVVGIPLGVMAGRLAWRLTARSLGVTTGLRLPWVGLVIVVMMTVLVVNLAAAGPGIQARRIRTADALRTE
jgi:ABC-type lipoprotein release transport system permease subunit